MPTYEYACSSCDTRHEVKQQMTDPTLTICPDCGQPTLRKLFSGVGIHFKGSGFYRTDSRDAKSSKAGSAASGKDASSTSAPSTTGSSPSTPATSAPSTSSTSSSTSSTPASS